MAAHDHNVTLDIRDGGIFDPVFGLKEVKRAIADPVQPDVYIIWPFDFDTRPFIRQLWDTHHIPIIQVNQFPEPNEWEYLAGYAGPDDALRARHAGTMLLEGIPASVTTANIGILGYPSTYGGTKISLEAFRGRIAGSRLKEVGAEFFGFGAQNGYLGTVAILDSLPPGEKLHGLYAMDDFILVGGYQALLEAGYTPGKDVILAGTVCNGARDLLDSGAQYGTTLQSPMLEGVLMVEQAAELLDTGNLSNRVAYTPNPLIRWQAWRDTVLPFGRGHVMHMDVLCSWFNTFSPDSGLDSVSQSPGGRVCDWVACEYIPEALFTVGYALLALNYVLGLGCAALLAKYWSTKVVSFAQPSFMALVILGSLIDTSSIFLMSSDNRNSDDSALQTVCTIWPWLLSLGHMTTTATLVAKIYRVKKVFTNSATLQRVRVRVRDVAAFIVAGLALDVAVLLAWYSSDPFRWGLAVTQRDVFDHIVTVTGQCTCDNCGGFSVAILGLHFLTLLYANVLAYQTREHAHISDSKPVAISLFNSVQLLVVVIPLLVMTADNVAVSYLIRVAFVFLNNFGVLCLIVVPRLYLAATGRADMVGVGASAVSAVPGAKTGGSKYATNNVVRVVPTEGGGLETKTQDK